MNNKDIGRHRSRLGFSIFWMTGMVFGWTVLRIILEFSFGPSGQPLKEVLLAFADGLWRDFFMALLLLIPLLIYMCVLPEKIWPHKWHRVFFWTFGATGTFGFLFLLVVEYCFFEEFKSRFNTVAVDYLIYPHEVFVNIWQSYPTIPVTLVCLAMALAWLHLARRWFNPMWQVPIARRWRLAATAVCFTGALALSVGMTASSPRVSSNRTLNEIANDGPLAFFSALWTHQLDYPAFYATIPKDEAYRRVRRMLAQPGSRFLDEGFSIRRAIDGDASRPKLNVVVILEESFGASFWGCLGRTNTLTPNMDRLATTEGLLFTNIYASGNRTVRGMEGVLSSFPPLPGDSIVRRPLTENVETLARVLRRDGYHTSFLYGGRGIFDSMRSYAIRNGYDRFIEQSDFAHPTFTTAWGVCDEDLFARGIQEMRQLASSNRPFFTTLLTVSNHRPYTFPEGRIPDPQRKRNSAVKYSDYALGRFFEQVKQESFWSNTVFVVVADHGARVYGKQTIPIHSYEIPFLVLGPAVVSTPQRIGTLGCSLDVAPTILGLIRRPYDSLFFGSDLLREPNEGGRAFLNHNRDVGMLTQENLVVLNLMKNLEFYTGNPKTGEMLATGQSLAPSEADGAKDCMAVYQVADDLYMHRRYALDDETGGRMLARSSR